MKIGVFGKTTAEDKNIILKAREIGKLIASKNHVVVTGGTGGYPHIVALAAINEGGKAIAYAAGKSLSDHAKFHNTDLSEYSKIVFQKRYWNKKLTVIDNYARSLDLCQNVDLAIVIGGRVGTMYEVTIVSALSKNIFILEGSGGITENTISYFINEGHKDKSSFKFFKDTKMLTKWI